MKFLLYFMMIYKSLTSSLPPDKEFKTTLHSDDACGHYSAMSISISNCHVTGFDSTCQNIAIYSIYGKSLYKTPKFESKRRKEARIDKPTDMLSFDFKIDRGKLYYLTSIDGIQGIIKNECLGLPILLFNLDDSINTVRKVDRACEFHFTTRLIAKKSIERDSLFTYAITGLDTGDRDYISQITINRMFQIKSIVLNTAIFYRKNLACEPASKIYYR